VVVLRAKAHHAVIDAEMLEEEADLIARHAALKPAVTLGELPDLWLVTKEQLKEMGSHREHQGGDGEETEDDEGVSGGVAHEW